MQREKDSWPNQHFDGLNNLNRWKKWYENKQRDERLKNPPQPFFLMNAFVDDSLFQKEEECYKNAFFNYTIKIST